MDTDELIDRLNTLQAQNIALMLMLATIANQAKLELGSEFSARCAIFRIVTEPGMDADSVEIQRETFAKVGRTILGERDALITE